MKDTTIHGAAYVALTFSPKAKLYNAKRELIRHLGDEYDSL